MQYVAVLVVGGTHEQEQAAWALANLGDNNDANRAAIAAALVPSPPWCGCWAATVRACSSTQPGRWRIWLSTAMPTGQSSQQLAASPPWCGC